MKTVIIGDIHGRQAWSSILEKNIDAKRFIFVGDYFDSNTISYLDQIQNFKNIIQLKEQSSIEIIMLIGNHDHHYFPDVIKDNMPKYQSPSSQAIIEAISENRHHLQMAFQFDNILCTHAGVGKTFLDRELGIDSWAIKNIANDLNELFKLNPLAFKFKNFGIKTDPTGDNIGQTPIWIRPLSLILDGMALKDKIIQVVGHTQMKTIPTQEQMGGGRFYFIDTLGGSCEYLVVENGIIGIKSE
jgi:hypothetical protein